MQLLMLNIAKIRGYLANGLQQSYGSCSTVHVNSPTNLYPQKCMQSIVRCHPNTNQSRNVGLQAFLLFRNTLLWINLDMVTTRGTYEHHQKRNHFVFKGDTSTQLSIHIPRNRKFLMLW